MLMNIRKAVVVCLAICLTVLQLLLPFVHAHFDHGDSPTRASGLHVHIANAESARQSLYEIKHHQVGTHAYQNQYAQMVAVDKGLFKEVDLPDFKAFVFILLVFFTVLSLAVQRLIYAKDTPALLQSYYSSFSTRAPPYC